MKIAVVGAGLMGRGIAYALSRCGCEVGIFDQSAEATSAAVSNAPDGADLRAVRTVSEAVQGSAVVFEAVAESLSVKLDLLAQVESIDGGVTFASNSSSFLPSQIADGARNPGQVLVAHFFNPADVVPLVEVVESPLTDPAVTELIMSILVDAGKRPVLLGKEAPGFVANRLQTAILRESIHLVASGVATPEQIDEVVTTSIGPRWGVAGPFRIADLGGLDIFAALSAQIVPTLDRSTEVPSALAERAGRGDLGVKTGRGFYSYDDANELEELRARIVRAFAGSDQH